MNREKVRSLLGVATKFYKLDDDTNTTDGFGFCHVFYDENNKCEAIEIFDEVEVYVNGLLIFPTDFETAKIILIYRLKNVISILLLRNINYYIANALNIKFHSF